MVSRKLTTKTPPITEEAVGNTRSLVNDLVDRSSALSAQLQDLQSALEGTTPSDSGPAEDFDGINDRLSRAARSLASAASTLQNIGNYLGADV